MKKPEVSQAVNLSHIVLCVCFSNLLVYNKNILKNIYINHIKWYSRDYQNKQICTSCRNKSLYSCLIMCIDWILMRSGWRWNAMCHLVNMHRSGQWNITIGSTKKNHWQAHYCKRYHRGKVIKDLNFTKRFVSFFITEKALKVVLYL